MLNVSHGSLKILCALFWYIGGIVLLLKGGSLLVEAERLKPGQIWPWLATSAGLLLGGLKAKFIFRRSCQRNLARISALKQPKIWQFFTPRFFVLLSLMIIVGTNLSRLAHGNHAFLIGVAILDFSIAVALIGSGYIFWTSQSENV